MQMGGRGAGLVGLRREARRDDGVERDVTSITLTAAELPHMLRGSVLSGNGP